MLVFNISDIQIQIIIKFGTAKLINMYFKAKDIPFPTQILNLKYIFINYAAPNQMLKYTITIIIQSKP